jgi:hypothetical protein
MQVCVRVELGVGSDLRVLKRGAYGVLRYLEYRSPLSDSFWVTHGSEGYQYGNTNWGRTILDL